MDYQKNMSLTWMKKTTSFMGQANYAVKYTTRVPASTRIKNRLLSSLITKVAEPGNKDLKIRKKTFYVCLAHAGFVNRAGNNRR